MTFDLATAKAIHAEVNSRIIYTPDMTRWGVMDKWCDGIDDAGGREDCDGYGIAHLRRILAAGCPPEPAKLWLCWTEPENPGYHAVCSVTIDGEEYVLDNRYPNVTRWQDTLYTWHQALVYVPASGKRKWVFAKSWDDHPVPPY